MDALISLWGQADLLGKGLIVLLTIHPVASIITAATPTPVDDTLYAWFYHKVVRTLALNKGLSVDKGTQG